MKKILFHLMLCFCAVCFCSADLQAQTVNFSEPVDGELSGNNLSPTDLLIFGVGNNTVGGTVDNATGATPNVDVFTFDIAAGTQLDTFSLNIFNSADNLAFVGIDDSNAFPFNATQLGAPGGPDQTQFIGGLLFGALGDITGPISNGGIGTGFSAPLGPGEYSVYVQQIGGTTVEYEFGFSVSEAIPEPGSAIFLGLALAGFAAKRRRR